MPSYSNLRRRTDPLLRALTAGMFAFPTVGHARRTSLPSNNTCGHMPEAKFAARRLFVEINWNGLRWCDVY
jgi:hypothetical protein